jgi:hypothetical protein
MKLEQIQKIIDEISIRFNDCFLKKGLPKASLNDTCLLIEFELKQKYSRSVDIHKFESILWNFKNALQDAFNKNSINVSFWSCSATEMEWTIN